MCKFCPLIPHQYFIQVIIIPFLVCTFTMSVSWFQWTMVSCQWQPVQFSPKIIPKVLLSTLLIRLNISEHSSSTWTVTLVSHSSSSFFKLLSLMALAFWTAYQPVLLWTFFMWASFLDLARLVGDMFGGDFADTSAENLSLMLIRGQATTSSMHWHGSRTPIDVSDIFSERYRFSNPQLRRILEGAEDNFENWLKQSSAMARSPLAGKIFYFYYGHT